MKIGYARVSTTAQSLELQIEALKKAGCEKVFSEKFSGKSKVRPELEKLLGHLRPNDILIVTKLDRLARSVSDLLSIMSELEKSEIGFLSIGEALDLSTPAGRMQMRIFAVMAEFERELISARTSEGLAYARSRGRVGGRRPVLTELQKKELVERVERGGVSHKDVAEIYKVSVSTVRRTMAEHRANQLLEG